MENIKNIVIKDLDTEFHFRIRLFGVEDGLNFIDKAIGLAKNDLSIKPFLADLLPLVSMLDTTGKTVVKESLTTQDCYSLFKNPLSVIDLGFEVLKFQQVFMKDSKICQELMGKVPNIWNTKTLESITP